MSREVGPPGGTTKANRDTKKGFKAWLVERRRRGLPPWVGPNNDRREGPAAFWAGALQQPHGADVLKSSWTLRQWADDYCQSRKIFKEFVYEKVRPHLCLNPLGSGVELLLRLFTGGTSTRLRRPFGRPSIQHIIVGITSKLALNRSTVW